MNHDRPRSRLYGADEHTMTLDKLGDIDLRIILVDLMTMLEIQDERLARIEAQLRILPASVNPIVLTKKKLEKIIVKTCIRCHEEFTVVTRRRRNGHAFIPTKKRYCRGCLGQLCADRLRQRRANAKQGEVA